MSLENRFRDSQRNADTQDAGPRKTSPSNVASKKAQEKDLLEGSPESATPKKRPQTRELKTSKTYRQKIRRTEEVPEQKIYHLESCH